MKAIRKYVAGGKVDDGSPTIEELGLAKRLANIRGGHVVGFLSLAGDVDFDRLADLDDDQIKALNDMATKYVTMFQGHDDGASGVIGKLKDSYKTLKVDLDRAAEITGLDRDEIKDIGYDIIEANPGDGMGPLVRGGAKALLYSLEGGGRVVRWR